MHRNIKILLSASILIHSGVNFLAPIFAIYIKDIGGTLLNAGIALGIYSIFKGSLFFILKKIEVFSKKQMIVIGYMIMCIGYLLYLWAYNPYHVYVIQAILAIGETVITPSWSAVIALSLTKGRERKIYSDFYGYRSFFEGTAAITGAIFAVNFGFTAVFILMSMMAFSASIISMFIQDLES